MLYPCYYREERRNKKTNKRIKTNIYRRWGNILKQDNKKGKNHRTIIAVDGPAGAGKSTITKQVADKLNFLYIDTGAMYRAITYAILKKNIDVNDENRINKSLYNFQLDFKKDKANRIVIYLNNRKISEELRTNLVDMNVSKISSYRKVREYMVTLQRKISESYNVILEGRDIGTVVFPDTPFKFYLDASVDERAKRRLSDSKNKEKLSFEKIKKDIIKRDKFDSNRELSPLKQAKDAVYIDSTRMPIDEVVDFIIGKIV